MSIKPYIAGCKATLVVALFLMNGTGGNLWADGKTSGCTKPEGKIQLSGSNVADCNGTKTIAIGKTFTLSPQSGSLKDVDCVCGKKVDDEIDTNTLKWTIVGSGSATGTGSQVTGTATDAPMNMTIKLEADDKANPAKQLTHEGFINVDTVSLNVVIPNKNDPTTTTVGCPTGKHGKALEVQDKLSRNGCTVDFQGLHLVEDHCIRTQDGCTFGATNNGGYAGELDSVGSPIGYVDKIHFCEASVNWSKSNCVSVSECYWDVASPDLGDWQQVFTREITYTMGNSAALDNLTINHRVKSCP